MHQQTSRHPRSDEMSLLNEDVMAAGPQPGSSHTRRVRSGALTQEAFEFFPASLQGELCWEPNAFRDAKKEYIFELKQTDISAIESAITSFKALGMALPFLTPDTFPLPVELGHRLRDISHKVHHGMGFAVLRGLDPKRYDDEENVIAYCGLASYVGLERVTNAFGMSMNHLRNAERDPRPKDREDMELNASKRSGGMKFHADRYYADILAMYFKENAASGGEQYLASFWTIYNRLMVEAPDVLEFLAQDWKWPPSSITLDGPVIYQSAGRVLVQLVWQPFIQNPKFLSKEQKQALDAVQEVAEHVSIELDHQAGDIQFVNNLAILHARQSFKDSTENSRHVLRMGIRDLEYGWTLPKQYEELTNLAFKPVKEQSIPVNDFDPYFRTTVAATTTHHG